MVATECHPFIKVGGLADVVGSLPIALEKLDVEAAVILPKYKGLDQKRLGIKPLSVKLDIEWKGKTETVKLYQGQIGLGIKIFFLEHDAWSNTEAYVQHSIEKYFLFSYAAIALIRELDLAPDIIHLHDYHTAVVPAIIHAYDKEYFSEVKTVLTIHNLKYQGYHNEDYTGYFPFPVAPIFEMNKEYNLLAHGVIHADMVTTVSRTYAKEIMTPAFGAGIDTLLYEFRDKIKGIINGIDTDFYDPLHDKHIFAPFAPGMADAKAVNKLRLLRSLGLSVNPDIPLLAMIGRLSSQKGLDILDEKIFEQDANLIILGEGKEDYEKQFKSWQKRHKDKFVFINKFSEETAHQIYSACDLFLMPSQFEPCGLAQMIAMRYGALVLARETGGLKDTVKSSYGFLFKDYDSEHLSAAIKRALRIFRDHDRWSAMQAKAMQIDFSWNRSAIEYNKIYQRLAK